MKFLASLGVAGFLAIAAIWLAGIIGWILNIVHVAHADLQVVTVKLGLQIAGIVIAPLGAVMGWLF